MTQGSESATAPQQDVPVLFVSRGRGWGHAVPDMAIASEVQHAIPEINIRFVSYASGAEAFRFFGHEVVDLGFPTDPPFLESLVTETRLLREVSPLLVVAHEECVAVLAAQLLGIPCIFLTDFFLDPTTMQMQILRYAAEIVFLGRPGLFLEPPQLRGRIEYVGNAVRRFDYHRGDRLSVRKAMGLSAECVVVLCQPGSWREVTFPIADLILRAWAVLPIETKQLLWLAGSDCELLASRFAARSDITVIPHDRHVDRLLVASDIVLTKCTRQTVLEAASLGIPTISLSIGANWVDDVAVERVPNSIVLDARTTSPNALAASIEKARSSPGPQTCEDAWWSGVAGAAFRIAEHIRRIRMPLAKSQGGAERDSCDTLAGQTVSLAR